MQILLKVLEISRLSYYYSLHAMSREDKDNDDRAKIRESLKNINKDMDTEGLLWR